MKTRVPSIDEFINERKLNERGNDDQFIVLTSSMKETDHEDYACDCLWLGYGDVAYIGWVETYHGQRYYSSDLTKGRFTDIVGNNYIICTGKSKDADKPKIAIKHSTHGNMGDITFNPDDERDVSKAAQKILRHLY